MASTRENTIKQYHLHKDEHDKLQFEIYCLKEYLSESEGHAEKPHSHSFYQIIWFTKGEGRHSVDFREYIIEENSIFFIPKGQVHCFDNTEYEGYILHFNEEFLADDSNEVNVFLKYNIFNSFENEPLFSIAEGFVDDFLGLLLQMQNEVLTPNQFAHKDYLKHLLNLFLIRIQRLGKRNNCKGLSINNPHHITYARFRQLIEDNYKNIHIVNEYASLLNISAKTLTTYTKEILSQTPLTVINERIVLEAKRLLSHSGLNVNEIAFQLGFEDPSYFVKLFKRYVKMSPTDFRKLISGNFLRLTII